VAAGAARRREIWERYDEALAGLPVVRPAPVEGDTIHARHLYTTLVDDRLGKSRDRVLDELIALRIGTGVHYTCIATTASGGVIRAATFPAPSTSETGPCPCRCPRPSPTPTWATSSRQCARCAGS